MDLTPKELEHAARSLGEDRDAWAPYVDHRADRRTFHQLKLDERIGIWLICWMDGHDTGFHDHDISSGAFTVVEGTLIEERLRFGAPPSSMTLEAGDSVHFSPTD